MNDNHIDIDATWGQVYLNDRLVEAGKAMVSALDRGLLYGDGIYETVRAYSGKPFMLESHFQRMVSGCSVIEIQPPPLDIIRQAVGQVLEVNRLDEAYLRITLTRGATGRLWYDPTPAEATLLIMAKPLAPRDSGKGVCLTVSGFRTDERSPLAGIKLTGILSKIIARNEAVRMGMDDALLLDTRGCISEATASNVFWVRDGRLYTSSLCCGILAGITRDIIISIAESQGIEVIQDDFRLDELLSADEMFLTSTTWEVAPVHRIDGTEFSSSRPITERLTELYRECVRNTLAKS